MRALASTSASILAILAIAACSDATPTDVSQAELSSDVQVSHADPMSQVSVMRSSVHWLSDLSDVEGASAQLTRTNSGASYTFHTTGLEMGHVVTMWWVIFNNPEECTNPISAIGAECGLPDLFDPDVQASVMGGQGHIVGKSGLSTHGGHLREGEITNYHPAFVGTPGLLDAMKAEIHLVLRTHGPKIPGMIQGMRTSFEVGCTPESSAGFGSGPNECADLQAAAFSAP